MRKPPPSPMECGLDTPLQKSAAMAASTAVPFLGRVEVGLGVDYCGPDWLKRDITTMLNTSLMISPPGEDVSADSGAWFRIHRYGSV